MKKISATLLGLCLCVTGLAQHINAVVAITEESTHQLLITNNIGPKLNNALATAGMAAENGSNWYLLCSLSEISKDISPTVPVKVSGKWELNLSMLDIALNKSFGAHSIALTGVGETEQQALQNALRSWNKKNLESFLKGVDAKVRKYYEANCSNLIDRASALAKAQNYAAALGYTTAMLQLNLCGTEVASLNGEYYDKYIRQHCSKLLSQARSAWSTMPDQYGAQEAKYYLLQIAPNTTCTAEARTLAKEITTALKNENEQEWAFLKAQAKSEQELNKLKLEAAMAVALAWNKNQNTTAVTIIK